MSDVLRSGKLVLAAGGFLFLSCCGDGEDPELKAELEKQQLLIEQKQTELSILKSKVSEARVDDPAEEVAELKAQLEEAEGLVKEATAEVDALLSRKKELEKEFEDYRKRYPMRSN